MLLVTMLQVGIDRYNTTVASPQKVDLDKFVPPENRDVDPTTKLGWLAYELTVDDSLALTKIRKQIHRRGWASHITEEGGYLFIRVSPVFPGEKVFSAPEVVKLALAWAKNITGG